MEKTAILRVLKHLVVHVHVDEHPVGTGEAAPDAETCTERGGDITIRHEGGGNDKQRNPLGVDGRGAGSELF